MSTLLHDPSDIAAAFTVGKAGTLARLARRFNVPPFVVLVPDADGEITQHDVDGAAEFVDSVGGLVAVRSSADVEDGAEGSFAGIFETELGVRTSELPSAIKRVSESVNSHRVTEYVEARGVSPKPISLAIVVQQMVAADRAGVAFSRISERTPDTLVEAVYGLGEGLVSGRLTPDRYVVTRGSSDVQVDSVGYQAVQLMVSDGKVADVAVPPFDRTTVKLLTSEVVDVAALSNDVETLLGYTAVDIEWAYVNGDLFLLQARPYTGYLVPTPKS